MHTGASYRRSRVITGPSHLGVYGPRVFIRCVIEKAKKTAQLGSKSSAFDGRVLLGLDRLGLNPVSQRHVTSGSCAGVWLIGCDPTDETDRCCSECGAAGRVRSSWRRRLYLVKSMFRVSSLIFFGCEKHCRTRPTNIEAIHFLFASLLRILHSTCAKRWNSAKILFAWYLLGWVAKRGCGTILRGGALWRRAFLANRGKETGP